jgi:TolB-like protein/DNA-binding CsgD family transcriptional regulator
MQMQHFRSMIGYRSQTSDLRRDMTNEQPGQDDPLAPLSKRERLIAERFAEGLTYREIGEALYIAPSTVRTHIAAIYRKLGIRNKATLVSLVARQSDAVAGSLSERMIAEPRGSEATSAADMIDAALSEDEPRALRSASLEGFSLQFGRHAGIAAVVLLALSAGGVWYAFCQPSVKPTGSTESASERGSPKQLFGQPSIAVLPFDNFGGGPEMDYFSDGLTEEIIIGLSQSPDLLVVSRNSSIAYRDEATDVRKIGQELGVQYVLEGSVRKDADTVRITAQLVDAGSGHHVWAERYDNEGSDVFLLQDDFNNKIISTLLGPLGVIRTAEYERSFATDDLSLRVYDYHLRGHSIYLRSTKEDTIRAREIWLEGLREFPDSGLLQMHVGWSYLSEVRRGWSADPQADLKQALEFARAGLAKEHLPRIDQFYGHWLLAHLSIWYLKDFDQAIIEAEKTLALYPGFSDSLASLCTIFLFSGEPGDALENIDEAIRRNPRPHEVYYRYKGWAHFMLEDYENAVIWLRKKRAYELPARRLLAASYAHLGRMDEAKAVVTEILEHHPDLTITGLSEVLPYRRSEDLERELAGLREAGLPPGEDSPAQW